MSTVIPPDVPPAVVLPIPENLSNRNRANIELVLLSTLASLILKSTMDVVFHDPIKQASDGAGLAQAIFSLGLFDFGVFLFTFLRFVYGAYRFHEEGPASPHPLFFTANAAGMIGLFVLFYFASLAITTVSNFYYLLFCVHAWDLVWFLTLKLFGHDLPSRLSRSARSFLVLDCITILILVALLYLCLFFGHVDFVVLHWTAGITLIVIGCFDFCYNYEFYVPRSL